MDNRASNRTVAAGEAEGQRAIHRDERPLVRSCVECGTPLLPAWLAQRPSATLCPECVTLTDFAPPGYTD
jgi:RNA polymerase-binding transcription factor DksA